MAKFQELARLPPFSSNIATAVKILDDIGKYLGAVVE